MCRQLRGCREGCNAASRDWRMGAEVIEWNHSWRWVRGAIYAAWEAAERRKKIAHVRKPWVCGHRAPSNSKFSPGRAADGMATDTSYTLKHEFRPASENQHRARQMRRQAVYPREAHPRLRRPGFARGRRVA